jgi:type II secretion system protein N
MGPWRPTRKRSYLHPAGYGIFAATLFAAFITTSFPYADTLSALLEPMELKMVCQRQDIKFPVGARLENVQLISTANRQSLLQSPSVTVAPGIMWFILGQPCLEIRAQIFGGLIDVILRQRAGSTLVDFKLESLDLALINRDKRNLQIQTAGNDEDGWAYKFGVVMSGELSGRGSAQLMRRGIIGNNARILLLGHDIKASLVDGLPPIEFGVARAKVAVDQDLAILQEATAYGRDGDLAASGRLQIAQDIVHSFVQLTLSMRPSAKARTAFGLFFKMLPHDPNEGPFFLQGMLASPSLS